MIREITIISEGATIDEAHDHLEKVMRRTLASAHLVMTEPDGCVDPVEGEWVSLSESFVKIPNTDIWLGAQKMRFSVPDDNDLGTVLSMFGLGSN